MGKFLKVILSQIEVRKKFKTLSEAQYHRFYVYFLNFLTSLKHPRQFFSAKISFWQMYFNMENISSVVSKKSEKIFFSTSLTFLNVIVEMRSKKNFLGFFRNHARNVLHIKIYLPERNFFRKKLSWVFQRGQKIQKIL